MQVVKTPGLVTVLIPSKKFKNTTALKKYWYKADALGSAHASPGDRVRVEMFAPQAAA